MPSQAAGSGLDITTISVARLLRCDCDHSFETERSLDLHKRDSLHHQRRAGVYSVSSRDPQEPLTSAFALTTLYSEITRTQSSAATLTYICGCISRTKAAFDQHTADAATYA